MNHLFSLFAEPLLPILLQGISAILGVLLIRITSTAKTRWGIEIEARHREALHAALMSGIRAALSRNMSGQAAITAAIQHALKSVPDAVAALDPEEGVLANIAEAKLREALGSMPWIGFDRAAPDASEG
ncbi:hypothetical protein [Celeribacter sp.]|uniref:hypothetical protein n=1 Tax=Celeribacter sp. TaxID=1890673 RepID=UPI003A938766